MKQRCPALKSAHESGRTIWVSRQVLREFAVVRSRGQAFSEGADPEIVIERLRYFSAHFTVADDTATVTNTLCRLMADIPTGGKQVHDANIVATMIAYDVPALLTHNAKDFERFAGKIRIETLNTGEIEK